MSDTGGIRCGECRNDNEPCIYCAIAQAEREKQMEAVVNVAASKLKPFVAYPILVESEQQALIFAQAEVIFHETGMTPRQILRLQANTNRVLEDANAQIASLETRLREQTARVTELETGIRQWASECSGCNYGEGATGFVFVGEAVTGRGPDDVFPEREPCPDCADIRALLPSPEPSP